MAFEAIESLKWLLSSEWVGDWSEGCYCLLALPWKMSQGESHHLRSQTKTSTRVKAFLILSLERVFILWLGFPRVVPIEGLAYKSHSLDSYRGITQPTLTSQNNYTASGTEILHFHVDHVGCWETSDGQFDVSIKHCEIVQLCNDFYAKYIIDLGE